jgi:uncharacterized RDD family membrane protein YckC
MMNEETSAPSTPPVATEDITGPRILAALIDTVVLVVVFVIFAALFGDTESSSGEDGAGFSLNLTGGPAIIYFLVVLAYYIGLEATSGQTLGKKVMGLRVVSAEGPYTTGKAVIRNVLRIVDGLPILIPYLVGLIVMVSSKNTQRIGDMAAGTIVVKI